MIGLEIGINCIFGFVGPWLLQPLVMMAPDYGGSLTPDQIRTSDQSLKSVLG